MTRISNRDNFFSANINPENEQIGKSWGYLELTIVKRTVVIAQHSLATAPGRDGLDGNAGWSIATRHYCVCHRIRSVRSLGN
jgi:hypothetical protein